MSKCELCGCDDDVIAVLPIYGAQVRLCRECKRGLPGYYSRGKPTAKSEFVRRMFEAQAMLAKKHGGEWRIKRRSGQIVFYLHRGEKMNHRGRPRKYDWDAIVADYTAGDSPKALRQKYGFHRNLIYYILKKKGVKG